MSEAPVNIEAKGEMLKIPNGQPKKDTQVKPRFDRPPLPAAAPILRQADKQAEPADKKLVDKPKPKGFKKILKNIFNTSAGRWIIAAVVTATGVGVAYDHYVLEPSRPIHQNYEEPTFDPSAVDTHINANNSVRMTLEEAEKEAPSIWNAENETMTIYLPIEFHDNRIPVLHITKMNDGVGGRQGNDVIQIDSGLEEGDKLVSEYGGTVDEAINPGEAAINDLFLYPDTDNSSQKRDGINFNMTLMPFDLGKPIKVDRGYSTFVVKKKQPLGNIVTLYNGQPFSPQLQIMGLSRSLTQKDFNLATSSGGKVIIIK